MEILFRYIDKLIIHDPSMDSTESFTYDLVGQFYVMNAPFVLYIQDLDLLRIVLGAVLPPDL